jgi:glycosyltransferase involved in cell wall biosynthesis
LKLAVVVCFRDEEETLGTLLGGLAGQQRRLDHLLLVDDGSRDGSTELAEAFARDHGWAEVAWRPRRDTGRDPLRTGGAIRAFQWGVSHLDPGFDVVGKLDADLDLPPDLIAEVAHRLDAQPSLGITGPYVSQPSPGGDAARLRCPDGHVLGATKFYRRECWDQISPLPEIMGWDTIDVARARLRGWETQSFAVPSRDPTHTRPMGSRDGLLRGYRRAGLAAYGFGAGPGEALLSALARAGDRPVGVASLHFAAGWAGAALRRAPRAAPAERRVARALQRRRIRAALAGRRPA